MKKKKQQENVNMLLPVVSEEVYDANEDDEYSVEGTEESVSASNSSKQKMPELAQSETRLVNTSKILVLIVLLLVSAGFAIATYRFTEKADLTVFESDVSTVMSLCVWWWWRHCMLLDDFHKAFIRNNHLLGAFFVTQPFLHSHRKNAF